VRVREFPTGTSFESESISHREINRVFCYILQLISLNNRHLEVIPVEWSKFPPINGANEFINFTRLGPRWVG